MLNDELQEAFNFALAEELIRELDPNVSTERIEQIYAMCKDNPWNAAILHKLLDLKSEY